MSGPSAPNSELEIAGFGTGGVEKGGLGAKMQAEADTSGSGKGMVADLPRAGAKGQDYTGSDTSRGDMDSAGFCKGGVAKDSLAAKAMSESGEGGAVKAKLQPIGTKKSAKK